MHLRAVQQRLASVHTVLRRSYKHQSKIFGYNTQLNTTGDKTAEIERVLSKKSQPLLPRITPKLFRSCIDDYHQARQANPHAALLIDAYRKHGHRLAKIDPLGINVNT